jgi:hypothetical protein
MNHTIQRLTVEINADSQSGARQRQDDLSRWCRTDAFWAMLSERLDRVVPDDVVVTIPRLEIDVDATDELSFQKDLIEKLVCRIQELPSVTSNVVRFQREEYVRQMALFFLENGFYPVTTSSGTALRVREFLHGQMNVMDTIFWKAFVNLTGKAPQALSRLIQQLGLQASRQILVRLIREYDQSAITEAWIESCWTGQGLKASDLSIDRKVSEEKVWWYLLQNPQHSALRSQAAFAGVFAQILNGERPSDAVSVTIKPTEKQKEQNEFYLENAGLVLLGPFLPQLFAGLGWMAYNCWVDDSKPHLAVRLLSYLANGVAALEGWENDWVLPKILCGVPLETVIFHEPILTQQDLDTGDDMLAAVAGFWKVLKSISPEGLRAMFLSRAGKLTYPDGGQGWRLQVERKAQDILLDHIPWGFGVTRLPWINEMVFVEW